MAFKWFFTAMFFHRYVFPAMFLFKICSHIFMISEVKLE